MCHVSYCMDIMANFSGGHHWPVQPSNAWTRLGIDVMTWRNQYWMPFTGCDRLEGETWARLAKMLHSEFEAVMLTLKISKCLCRFVYRMMRLWYSMTVLRIVFLAPFAGLAFCATDNCWQHLTVSLETQSKQETRMFHGVCWNDGRFVQS